MRTNTIVMLLLALVPKVSASASEPRSTVQQEYADSLWKYANDEVDYLKWKSSDSSVLDNVLPPAETAQVYLNTAAQQDNRPRGSVIVAEHLNGAGEKVAVTIAVRAKPGYNSKTNDWYWSHFLADGTVVKTSVDKSPHNKPGFVTFNEDGRLWVFKTNASELASYFSSGELAKHVIRPAAGPSRMTIKAPDAETIDLYLTRKDGFVTQIQDGRLWVFREGAEEFEAFKKDGELAKHVIRPAAGPGGMTVKAPDNDTILEYLAAREGFSIAFEDGRMWVFRDKSPELAEFEADGEPAKHVIRPGAGPLGMTIKGPDSETIEEYLN